MCITIAANIAETGILQFPACFPDSVIGFIADKNECNVYFIEYVFRLLRKRIQAQATGSVQDNINLQTLERLLFPIPDLDEQNRIAEVLCAFDDKIQLNRQTNQTLEQIAQAIFKSWFVNFEPVKAKAIVKEKGGNELAQSLAAQAIICGAVTLEQLQALQNDYLGLEAQLHPLIIDRFSDQAGLDDWTPETLQTTAALFPDALVESELGEIPEGWSIKSMEELSSIVAMGPFGSNIKVSTFVDDGVPVVSGQHLKGLMLEDNQFNFVTIEHADKLKKANVMRGDVVFTHAGSIGQVAYIPDKSRYERYVLSQRQFYMRPNPKLISPLFITYYFKSHIGQYELLSNASQVGVPSISRPVSNLRKISAVVPNKDLSDVFHVLANTMHNNISVINQEINILENIRDYLLPRLLTGELALNNVKTTTEAVA